MPHIVIEYSVGLERSLNMHTLMQSVLDAACKSEVMKAEDVKIRAIPYQHFLLADGGDSFVHTTVHLLAGRAVGQKVRLSELLREHMKNLLPQVHSISVDIVDMDCDTYRKRLL